MTSRIGVLALLVVASTTALSAQQGAAQAIENLVVTEQDVQILLRASKILSHESVWNRADNRECPPEATSWSLYCALHKASLAIRSEFNHRQPAMQMVRFVINLMEPGRRFEHRLMNYNNDPQRTLSDIQEVLRISIQNVRKKLAS